MLAQAVTCMNKLTENNDTKDLLDFLREENDKNREAQMKMHQMECNNFLQIMKMMMPQGNSQIRNVPSTPSFTHQFTPSSRYSQSSQVHEQDFNAVTSAYPTYSSASTPPISPQIPHFPSQIRANYSTGHMQEDDNLSAFYRAHDNN